MSPSPSFARRRSPARARGPRAAGVLLLLALSAAARADPPEAGQEPGPADEDVQTFLFVPYPVTEPAVGTGLLAGPVWMREGPPEADAPARPQAFGAGVLWTDGGSRGLVGFDRRAWGGGRWWTTAVALDAELALRYGGLDPGQDQDLGFTLDLSGLSVEGEVRLAGRPDRVGLRLFAGQADLAFDDALPPEFDPSWTRRRVNGFAVSYIRDLRDDTYSPTRGTHLQGSATVYASWLGASFDAQALGLRWTRYGKGLAGGVLGLRVVLDASHGDAPFYLRPYVSLRGVPALRYAGEQAASLELEQRWPLGERWELLAFGGAGSAHSERAAGPGSASVTTGGMGFRFKARKYFGLTFGVDLAHGPDGLVTYLQIGNAWAR